MINARYGEWHTRPEGSPWQLRDKLARLVGYHCWDCCSYDRFDLASSGVTPSPTDR